MADANYEVVVSAGNLRPHEGLGVVMPHPWTAEGVAVEADFTGAHLYHLAAAGCILNDLYREAQRVGVALDGAKVSARGKFGPSWASTGITYDVEVATAASDVDVERLLRVVDEVAEIPKALRSGTTVVRNRIR